jgi:hypothetical protein
LIGFCYLFCRVFSENEFPDNYAENQCNDARYDGYNQGAVHAFLVFSVSQYNDPPQAGSRGRQ